MSQVPVMVNAALFSSGVKLIFRFQVTRHWQQADPLLTERARTRHKGILYTITFSHSSTDTLSAACEHSFLCEFDRSLMTSRSIFFSFCHFASRYVSLLIILPVFLSFTLILFCDQKLPDTKQCIHLVHTSASGEGAGCFDMGEETHTSLTSQINVCLCVCAWGGGGCFCLLYLFFSASPSNSFSPRFLSPPLAANYCPA